MKVISFSVESSNFDVILYIFMYYNEHENIGGRCVRQCGGGGGVVLSVIFVLCSISRAWCKTIVTCYIK